MIDLHVLRSNPDVVAKQLAKKDPQFPLADLIACDKNARQLQMKVEELRSEKKHLSKGGEASPEVRERSRTLGIALKSVEHDLAQAQEAVRKLWLRCPNLALEAVPVGTKQQNQVVRSWGTDPEFTFSVQNHLELNKTNKWFDMDAGARMSGAQFVFYTPLGTKIVYALTQMMLRNNVAHGFQPVMPPSLVTEKALYNSGNLPKFAGDFYQIPEDDVCLIPTSEVCLTNLHAQQIIETADLPLRYTSWTSCFRREAGGYGALERGLIRIHQFEKVELYALTEPEKSGEELERMISCAEQLLKQLELSYQVSLLAGQDTSFSAAQTFDIEVWLPGQKKHYEVSSASNCTDFQARRAQIRHRNQDMKKPELVHTLNASSLALPRLMVALMEQGQQADGSIVLPQALQETLDSLW